jgi:hypothetical protein
MFAVVSTQNPSATCYSEFLKMKEEEPWANILKDTRYVIFAPFSLPRAAEFWTHFQCHIFHNSGAISMPGGT